MFNNSMNFIRRFSRENLSFQIWWLISGMAVIKIQNFTSVSPKLCLLGQKNRDMGCEYTTIDILLTIQVPALIVS